MYGVKYIDLVSLANVHAVANSGFEIGGPAPLTSPRMGAVPGMWEAGSSTFYGGVGSVPIAGSTRTNNVLLLLGGDVKQVTNVVPTNGAFFGERAPREYTFQATVTLPPFYTDSEHFHKTFEIKPFKLQILSGDVVFSESATFNHADYQAHFFSGDSPWVVSTSWRMPPDFVGTVPLTLGIKAVEPVGTVDPTEGSQPRLTAFDDITLCQSADGCNPAYPKCNKPALDVLLLVDNSGSIKGEAKFEKARAFVKKLRKYVVADSQLAEPKVDRVRVEIATFAQRSSGTLQIIWDGISNDHALSNAVVANIDDAIDNAIVRSMIDNHKTNIGEATLLAVKDEFVKRSKSSMRAVVIITDGDEEKTEPDAVFQKYMAEARGEAELHGKTCFYVMSSNAVTIGGASISGADQSKRVVGLRTGTWSPAVCQNDLTTETAQKGGPDTLAKYLLKDATVLVGEHSCQCNAT